MEYEIIYCIGCEEDVVVEKGATDHTILVGNHLPFDVEVCQGPFATTPPPSTDYDWDLMDEPSPYELAQMDLYAEELWKEL